MTDRIEPPDISALYPLAWTDEFSVCEDCGDPTAFSSGWGRLVCPRCWEEPGD